MKNKVLLALSCLFISGLVAGCGVKPKNVEPPEGAENSTFPRTYPDLSTDPRP